jgi:eukaryotic-like serine/threonine-protein kinase
MGEVYRAHDARLDRDVAVKVLNPSATSHDARAAMMAEARAVSSLSHPHICVVHEVDEIDGHILLVMELVEGQTLADTIGGHGLPVDSAVRYASQIASALAHAHWRGVVHRDLKSVNAMVTRDGVVKVLDFGIARRTAEKLPEETTQSVAPLESLGVIAGTLPYMAPEVILGAPADPRADIWALGVMLVEMVTGRRPFEGQTAFDLTSAIVHAPPPELPARAPIGLRTIVRRCLQKQPGERYQSAGEISAALDAVASATPAAANGRSRARALAAGLAGAAVLAGILGWTMWGRTPAPIGVESLVVLPFADLTPGPESEYLADGVTDAVITELGQLGPLRVTSRTSSMRYRNSDKSMAEIAGDLGVDSVLEGSLFRNGQRVRVTARLVRAATESTLWTGSYERDLGDLLSLQRDLAQTVARELRLTLTADHASQLSRQETNPDAIEAYLKGRYQWAKRTPASLLASIELFEAASRADPTYALPYAGLAASYVLLGSIAISERPSVESLERAKAEARRALALDPLVAEAHTALAYAMFWSWDFDESERAFRRAIELNPNDATTRFWYAIRLAAEKRFEESIAEASRGQQLDPVSPIVTAGLSWSYHLAGRFAESADWARKVLEIEPDFIIGLSRLGVAYKHLGAHERAVEALQRAVTQSGRNPDHLAQLGQTYALAGRIKDAEAIIAELETQSKTRHVPFIDRALIYASVGRPDDAFMWLRRSYDSRENALALLDVDPDLNALRADPRFDEIVRRVGLRRGQ